MHTPTLDQLVEHEIEAFLDEIATIQPPTHEIEAFLDEIATIQPPTHSAGIPATIVSDSTWDRPGSTPLH